MRLWTGDVAALHAQNLPADHALSTALVPVLGGACDDAARGATWAGVLGVLFRPSVSMIFPILMPAWLGWLVAILAVDWAVALLVALILLLTKGKR